MRPSATHPLLLLPFVLAAVAIPFVCGWWSRPSSNGSLLEAGTARAHSAMGIPRQVLEGPLAVETGDVRIWQGVWRAPVLSIPYAILMVWWAAVGLVFDYSNLYLHSWSSVALVLFCVSTLAWFALGSEARTQPNGRAPGSR